MCLCNRQPEGKLQKQQKLRALYISNETVLKVFEVFNIK